MNTFNGITIDHERLVEICRRYHVRELALFGSTARGDNRPESDVDIMIEYDPHATPGLIDFSKLRFELEDLMARRVDLVTKRGLKPLVRQHVVDESVVLYAA